MNRVDYLVIADTKDFTSDYITIELNKRKKGILELIETSLVNIKFSGMF